MGLLLSFLVWPRGGAGAVENRGVAGAVEGGGGGRRVVEGKGVAGAVEGGGGSRRGGRAVEGGGSGGRGAVEDGSGGRVVEAVRPWPWWRRGELMERARRPTAARKTKGARRSAAARRTKGASSATGGGSVWAAAVVAHDCGSTWATAGVQLSRAVDENTSASAVLTNPTALRLLYPKHFARLPKDASATTAPVGRTRRPPPAGELAPSALLAAAIATSDKEVEELE
uniref:Uncharacterized protein n=1 Tax=Oryza sativa subsp. japonica TaxID=39947 RepID=Q6H4F2_ORYSJ|nr:hypothetical protein [Oryza sativa Japonica Group]